MTHVQPEGEVEGISYGIRGKGAPLVLLPLFISPSQWEPMVARLAERYCTITLGGFALGAVALLESRGRSAGYHRMLQSLVDEAGLKPNGRVAVISRAIDMPYVRNVNLLRAYSPVARKWRLVFSMPTPTMEETAL